MMNIKFILGVIVGALLLHFYYKRKYDLKGNRIDKRINQIKSNVANFLETQGMMTGREYNPDELADQLVDENTEVKPLKQK